MCQQLGEYIAINMILKRIILAAFLGFILFSGLQLVAQSTVRPKELAVALAQFGNDSRMRSASWGLVVIDVSSGDTIAAVNPHEALVPASTLKIITTASALEMLDTNFRYQTLLGMRGNVGSTGILHGDLIIRGSGDPTFGWKEFAAKNSLDSVFTVWYHAIKNAGIRKISGRVFVDETIFDDQLIPRTWIWENMGNHFGAGTSGMSVLNNRFTVFFQAGDSLGKPASVLRTEPEVPGMILQNTVTTGPPGSGDQVWIFGAPFQMERLLTGTVPLGQREFPVHGSLPDPPMFVAAAFANFLHNQGIHLSKAPVSARISRQFGLTVPQLTDTLSVWVSSSLMQIANFTNFRSDNSFSEALLKTIAHRKGHPATTAAGAAAIRSFWQNQGINTQGMFLFDGSGLSPSNRVTAGQLAHILNILARRNYFPAFSESLPLAGQTGSLAHVFRGTKSQGVLRAKTGTLSHVRAFAGYTKTQSGRTVAFAFLVNHFHGTGSELRNEMVLIMDAITRYNQ